MGRNVAGTSFLKGLLRHSEYDRLTALVTKDSFKSTLEALIRGSRYEQRTRTISMDQLSELTGGGPVFFPGPNIGHHAWHRRFYGDRAWSLCGITHTLSSASAMDAIADLLSAPVYAWDALICTSSAARSLVRNILERQAAYLADRFGARIVHRPMLPVIPLGVHAEEFEQRESMHQPARAQLGIGHDETVVLFVGRLSFHAKAHPMASYQALEAVSRASGAKLVLIEAGIHANDYIKNAFTEASKACSPSVRTIQIDGKNNEAIQLAWCAADIFCSLSDNVQETFGITPVEAMAGGLPVIASDWDGYRDTVDHGVTGFLVQTIQPPPDFNIDLAIRHAFEIDSYDMYCGHTSMQVGVSIDGVVKALEALMDPALRKSMGEAGKLRVQKLYDWRMIIPKYDELWAQLTEEIASAPDFTEPNRKATPLANHWPARPDPFAAFSKFASSCYSDETAVKKGSASWSVIKDLAMVKYVPHLFGHENIPASLSQYFESLREDEVITVTELLQAWPLNLRAQVLRILAVFVKLDVARVHQNT